MKKKIKNVGLIVMLSMVFVACTADKEVKVQESPIQIALTQDILSFDPMKTSDIYSEAVLRCVYTSLYEFDEELNLQRKLVKEETQIDDQTWKIQIHENVKFQNGEMLTTDDVIFSIERARKGGRTEKALEPVEKVEKVDDTTFLIRAKEPYKDFLSLFAKAETSIVSKSVVETDGYDFEIPIGAGPFKLLDREVGKQIRLERFEDYYLGQAESKYLNFLIIVTEQERTTAFLSGNVDILFSVSAYDCDKLKLSEGVTLLQKASTKIEYLSLNNLHQNLDNQKVRQAISYAIDREKIAKAVYHGYSNPASSVIPKGITGYVESPISYNPEKARELLKEAGCQEGLELTVITIDTIRKNTLEYIKVDLAEVGITLNYNLVTMQEAVDIMTAGEHDGILVGWAFNSDPNGVLPLIFGTGSGKTMNSCNYSNPEVDQLLKQGREEQDKEKKREIYEQVNNILIEDSPIVVLQNPMILSAARDNIEGIHMNPQGIIRYENIYRK